MTQIFDKDNNLISVSVIEAGPCFILGLIESPRLKVKLGYEAVKETKLPKPQLGYFKKIGVTPLRYTKEIESSDNKNYKVGQEVKVDVFKAGDFVSVRGVSIGKGFQGGMKRWNWIGGPGSHGSMHHRRVGSIGSSTTPGRTYRGRTMPGHMGAENVLVENLRVMGVDLENNLLLLKGAVPGHKSSLLTIMLSRKRKFKALDEQKVVVEGKKNPMKASKAKVGGKGGK